MLLILLLRNHASIERKMDILIIAITDDMKDKILRMRMGGSKEEWQ
jgi:hypothetical protein